ncbi:unnamed protein product, partial [Rangifer tarandus platyrhynchus]
GAKGASVRFWHCPARTHITGLYITSHTGVGDAGFHVSITPMLWSLLALHCPPSGQVRNDLGATPASTGGGFWTPGCGLLNGSSSIKSFIRELNLYGFRKIRPSGRSAGRKKMMIYRNSNFQRDKPLLLQNIQRKGNPRTTSQPATGTTATPKRKKRVMATRHSPRLHHNEFTQETGNKVQKAMPTACRNPSQCLFVFSDLWSMGSVASQAGGNHLPSEQGGPSGEGPSNSATSVLPATNGRDSPGELPESPPVYPDYESLMTLYNTCYSILMAGLLVMAPDEAPESEEEQGDSQIINDAPESEEEQGEISDYKCALCKHFKDKPNP